MEGQTAGRAVTITPFRSIQTFWQGGRGGGQRREGKGRKIKWGGGLTACMTQGESFRLEYTVCTTAGWGMQRDMDLGRVSRRPCEKGRGKSAEAQWKEKMVTE